MSEPFNKKARKAALDCWNEGHHVLSAALDVEVLLLNGDVRQAWEIRQHLTNLGAFVQDMKRAIQGIDEEDA